jgi:hypothetical protein
VTAGIAHAAAIPLDQAQEMVQQLLQEQGYERGVVPSADMSAFVRLCSNCASKTGTAVAPLVEGQDVLTYDQRASD